MTVWEEELTAFFTELEATQEATMEVLRRKQTLLTAADAEGLKAITEEERQMLERLETSLAKREKLLEIARAENLPADSIERLSETLPKNSAVHRLVRRSVARTRMIRYQSLTNWILVQRSLIHLNQLLEMIAHKGGTAPTYSRDKKKETPGSGGSLVDKVA